MNYKKISDLDAELISLLEDINQSKVFRSVYELDEYVAEQQIICEYEVYTTQCWNLAKILSFEGYDLIEYAQAYDFKNCDNLVGLVDLLIQDYFLDHCEFNKKTQKIVWSKPINY